VAQLNPFADESTNALQSCTLANTGGAKPKLITRTKTMTDTKRNVLFVCSKNQWRSPTAETLYRKQPGLSVRSAGTSSSARHQLNADDVQWANIIFVMEDKHLSRMRAEHGHLLATKSVHVLDIPDEYKYMAPELVELLQSSVDPILLTQRYQLSRQQVLARFDTLEEEVTSEKRFLSPSGKFFLSTSIWTGADGGWSYSRGLVRRSDNDSIVADIQRNHAMFWHCWVAQGGREYLLCGEDYQGYNVIEADSGRNVFTFPPEAFEGRGFCWTGVKPSPDCQTLAVEGCFWACEAELVLFNFSNPMASPLPEKSRIEHLKTLGHWLNNEAIEFTVYPAEDYE
jgi:predicted protein tyrosine phosphatase